MSEVNEMYEKMGQEIRGQKPKMAICYDFDKTLSPDDMQTFTLIPSFGILPCPHRRIPSLELQLK